MKICYFHPYPFTGEVGGTDIYVLNLIETIKTECSIFIVCPGTQEKHDIVYGIEVISIPFLYVSDLLQLEGLKKPGGLKLFKEVLHSKKPDVLHFQGFGKWQNEYLKLAYDLGIKTIITPHISSLTCGKTSLITPENFFCNGLVNVNVCGKCLLDFKYGKGINYYIMLWVSRIINPQPFFYKNKILKRFLVFEQVKNTKSMLSLIQENVTGIIVLNEWYKDVLILNRISSQKIKIIKTTIKSSEVSSYRPCKPVKLLFAGRQNKEKGLELLLDAIDNIAQNSIELHLCGPIETTTFSLIEKKIRRLTKKGYIIVQHGLIHNNDVQDLLSKSHILCYPSIDAEMCPLTILEAQAKNIPVIGANHSGIKDLIADKVNGLLFDSGDIISLRTVLQNVLDDLQTLVNIHNGLKVFNSKKKNDAFNDHLTYYKEITSHEN